MDEINCTLVAMQDVELKLNKDIKNIIINNKLIFINTNNSHDLSYLCADIFLNASTSDKGDANINISLTSKSKQALLSLKQTINNI